MVSRYCLKFFASNNFLYCIKGAPLKIICAFGAPMFATFLFVSNKFLIYVSRVEPSFRSISIARFILPRLQGYLKRILKACFD